MQRIETKSLHKGVAGARHTFLKQQPGQDKLNLLLQVGYHLLLAHAQIAVCHWQILCNNRNCPFLAAEQSVS